MGIDQYNLLGGVSRGVYVRKNPWHGLSDTKVRFEHTPTVEEAVETAFPWNVTKIGLDEVLLAPGADEYAYTAKVTHDPTDPENGRILGVHSPRRGVLDPRESLVELANAVQFVDPRFEVKTAVELHHGKVIFVVLGLADNVELGGGAVSLERNLVLVDSFDGKYALGGTTSDIVAECMNMLAASLAGGTRIFSLRHTSGVVNYVEAAKQLLAIAVSNYSSIDEEVEKLLAQPFTKDEFTGLLVPAIVGKRPTDEGRKQTLYDARFDKIVAEWGATGQESAEGTAWGALMAVNSYELWEQPIRGRDRSAAQVSRFLDNSFPLTSKAHAVLSAN
jgi:hypothetical protein